MTASSCFEDRLLAQLRRVVAESPQPAAAAGRRARPTRLALGGIGIAAAIAGAAIVATGSDVTSSAFAVQARPDGAVTVSIHSLADADGLQQRLRAAGVPAVVDYVPSDGRGCVGPGPAGAPAGAGGAGGAPSAAREQGLSTHTGTAGDGPSLSGSGPQTARRPGETKERRRATTAVAVGGDGVTFTIDPGTLRPGEKVYITTSTGAVSSIAMAIATARPGVACATTP